MGDQTYSQKCFHWQKLARWPAILYNWCILSRPRCASLASNDTHAVEIRIISIDRQTTRVGPHYVLAENPDWDSLWQHREQGWGVPDWQRPWRWGATWICQHSIQWCEGTTVKDSRIQKHLLVHHLIQEKKKHIENTLHCTNTFHYQKINITHTMKYIELNGFINLCFYYILTLAYKRWAKRSAL